MNAPVENGVICGHPPQKLPLPAGRIDNWEGPVISDHFWIHLFSMLFPS